MEQRQRALHEQRDSSKKGMSNKELGVGDKKKKRNTAAAKKNLFFLLGLCTPFFFLFWGGALVIFFLLPTHACGLLSIYDLCFRLRFVT